MTRRPQLWPCSALAAAANRSQNGQHGAGSCPQNNLGFCPSPGGPAARGGAVDCASKGHKGSGLPGIGAPAPAAAKASIELVRHAVMHWNSTAAFGTPPGAPTCPNGKGQPPQEQDPLGGLYVEDWRHQPALGGLKWRACSRPGAVRDTVEGIAQRAQSCAT